MASPMQTFPPCAGAGSEQSRMRFWEPSSHVFEQEPHEDQGDQLPFTKQRWELIQPISNQSVGQSTCEAVYTCSVRVWIPVNLIIKIKEPYHCNLIF